MTLYGGKDLQVNEALAVELWGSKPVSWLVQVKLFVETFQSQMISNTLRIVKADTRATLADAAKSTDAALKVSIPAITIGQIHLSKHQVITPARIIIKNNKQ